MFKEYLSSSVRPRTGPAGPLILLVALILTTDMGSVQANPAMMNPVAVTRAVPVGGGPIMPPVTKAMPPRRAQGLVFDATGVPSS